MKDPAIFKKAMQSSFSRKPFVFPSGRVDYVMGYEPIAIKELLKCYSEDDIITDIWCIPTFDYERVSSDLRPLLNKPIASSRYFPDILLPDKIIEVKSLYLFKRDRCNIVRKMHAVAKAGWKCELWVYISEKKLKFKKMYELYVTNLIPGEEIGEVRSCTLERW
jgi:hypothetical protein